MILHGLMPFRHVALPKEHRDDVSGSEGSLRLSQRPSPHDLLSKSRTAQVRCVLRENDTPQGD
jgi:hypothetical protein